MNCIQRDTDRHVARKKTAKRETKKSRPMTMVDDGKASTKEEEVERTDTGEGVEGYFPLLCHWCQRTLRVDGGQRMVDG